MISKLNVNQDLLLLRLTAVMYGAENINLYEFRAIDNSQLPPFTAGGHIDLYLPSNIMRQYSLANPQTERDRYVVGIKRDVASRGGSQYFHETLRVGTLMQASPPRNNFPLVEDAEHSVFFAGGIGVTPIRSMINRLASLGRPWELHYSIRKRSEAVFFDEFVVYPENFHLHVDEENPGKFLDILGIVSASPWDAHLYCCGPLPMLAAFEASTAERPPSHIHVEYFTSNKTASVEGGYTVRMAKSGKEVIILPGQTILDAVRASGIDAPFSCAQGVCGACETRVLDGIPDHRDMILSEREKAANRNMMICCSGSKTPLLVLDI